MKPEPIAARDISRRSEPGNQSVHLSWRSSVQINYRLRSRNLPDVQCRWPKIGASAHRAQQKHSMKHMKTNEKLPLWSRRFQQGRLKKSEVSRRFQLHPMQCPWKDANWCGTIAHSDGVVGGGNRRSGADKGDFCPQQAQHTQPNVSAGCVEGVIPWWTFGGFHSQRNTPKAGWFVSWKIHLSMDDDWG